MKKEPHFSRVLRDRRKALLKRILAEPDPTRWGVVKAIFAVDYGIRKEKVDEYFNLLVDAELITLE